MTPRRPIIADPVHLAELAGTACLCVRPTGRVAEVHAQVQRRLRETVGEDRASWPDAHMSLGGFGTPDRPVDSAIERKLVSVAEQWARETPPLRLDVEGVEVFSDDRIPIVRIRRTPTLGAAHKDVRERVEASGLPGQDDIALQDWAFHLSLVYYGGERWPEVEAAARNISVPTATCVVGESELVGFDGGFERLLGRFSLLGRPSE